MFRSSKVVVMAPMKPNANGCVETEEIHDIMLKVKIPKLYKLLRLGRSGRSKKFVYAHEGEGEVLAPIKKVVEIPLEDGETPTLKPQPPPLPYRLTFKSRKQSKNPWSRHKSVSYELGFNSVNVTIRVDAFESGLRRVFINNEEIAREVSLHLEWSVSHFFSDRSKSYATDSTLGVIFKVVVSNNLQVNLFADGFPVEKLRRSSTFKKGSPPPPVNMEDIETLDKREVARLSVGLT